MSTASVLLSAGAGALAMYLLDPSKGRYRRSIAKGKATRVYHDASHLADKAQRDFSNRAKGIRAQMDRRNKPDDADDHTLYERVRSKLGRLVSHPHSVEVRAANGIVTLAGPVLRNEWRGLVSGVGNVPGVHTVEDHLSVHDTAENVPGLQGAGKRHGGQFELMQHNWTPAVRVTASMLGSGLVLYGATSRSAASMAAAAAGAGLLTRAVLNRPVREWAGKEEEEQQMQIRS